MAEKGKSPGTLEIIIAVGTVLFVFSMIGILQVPTLVEDLQIQPSVSAPGMEEAVEVDVRSEVSGTGVEEAMEKDVTDAGEPVESPLTKGSGTKLSPSTSSFMVE